MPTVATAPCLTCPTWLAAFETLQARWSFELVLEHIPGEANRIADGLYRGRLAASTEEWQLRSSLFRALDASFGPHWADLMADPEGRTAHLPQFFSVTDSVLSQGRALQGRNSSAPQFLLYIIGGS